MEFLAYQNDKYITSIRFADLLLMLTDISPGVAPTTMAPKSSKKQLGLENVPPEICDIVVSYLDKGTLRKCLLIRALFESAVNILWRDVTLPFELDQGSRTVVRLLRKGGVPATKKEEFPAKSTTMKRVGRSKTVIYPYGAWIRSLSVLCSPNDVPLRHMKEIAANLKGSFLKHLVLYLRNAGSQELWASLFASDSSFADQIQELHLIGIDTITTDLVDMISLFHNLEHLRIEIRETAPEKVRDLVMEAVDSNPRLSTLEFSDSALWLWDNIIRLEGSLGTMAQCGQNLTSLCLRGFRFCDNLLLNDLAAGLPKLMDLGLKDFWLAEGVSFNSFFDKLPKLRSLRMENTTPLKIDSLSPQTELKSLALYMDFPPELLGAIANECTELVDLDLRGLSSHVEVDLELLVPMSYRLESLYLNQAKLAKENPDVEFFKLKQFGLGPAVQPVEGTTLGATAANKIFSLQRFPSLRTVGLAAFYGNLGDRVNHVWLDSFIRARSDIYRVFLGVAHSSFVADDRLPRLKQDHKSVSFECSDWFPDVKWA